jgi:hypothetical protein
MPPYDGLTRNDGAMFDDSGDDGDDDCPDDDGESNYSLVLDSLVWSFDTRVSREAAADRINLDVTDEETFQGRKCERLTLQWTTIKITKNRTGSL